MPVMVLFVLAMAPVQARVMVVSFDGEQVQADRNDWGKVEPLSLRGFRLTAPGEGCPANPSGRALDAGFSPETRTGNLAFELPTDANLRQGTVEMWLKPYWGSGHREIHGFFHIKLRGGPWHGIALVYHGTIGANVEAFGANIMDGVDHPAYLSDAKSLNWQPAEWHHLAFTWTEHSEWVFVDGKLVAQLTLTQPLLSFPTEGQACIGCNWQADAPTAGGLIDEFRLCDVPLYSRDHPPEPMRVPRADLGLGLATLEGGAQATADSVAPPQSLESDVPELHDGQYSTAATVGLQGQGMVIVYLAAEAEACALEWSRDGAQYAGPEGRGWATVLPWPVDFTIETSPDGQSWEPAAEVKQFEISPQFVATHQALRFRHEFPMRRVRAVRMKVLRAQRNGPNVLLDEVAVYGPDGQNLARLPGVRVQTALTAVERRYDPTLAIDGRWGEESCWKSVTPGTGRLTIELPEAVTVSQVVFSRNHEGLAQDGTPSAGTVEVSADGQTWEPVGEILGAEPKPRVVTFAPRHVRWVRLLVTATVDGKEAVVDDVRVY